MKKTKESEWIAALRAKCKRAGSQAKVSREIGYSAGVVNAVLKGTYKGDLKRIEQAVRGALMNETVDCPVLGEMRKDKCLYHQKRPFAATNPTRVQLYLACPKCRHRQRKDSDSSTE